MLAEHCALGSSEWVGVDLDVRTKVAKELVRMGPGAGVA
jgi:hypothetical protein